MKAVALIERLVITVEVEAAEGEEDETPFLVARLMKEEVVESFSAV